MMTENWEEIRNSKINFQEHLRSTLIFPKIEGIQNRLLVLPLDVLITKEGNLASIEYSKSPPAMDRMFRYKYADQFLIEAKKVFATFADWVPDKVAGEYQETRRYLPIHFFYHLATITDPRVILNPEIPAKYVNKTRDYEYTIQGKFGCDGIGEIIVIIDEYGNPKHIEYLSVVGKTNYQIIEEAFLQLGNWEPAKDQGKSVKSQVVLTIYA
ncbi:MAG: hypothetical protein ACKV1O_19010 [Saprospiraceae bacterium]